MVQDHLGHCAWKKPNGLKWMDSRFVYWFTMIQVILDHWSWFGSRQGNAAKMEWCQNHLDHGTSKKTNEPEWIHWILWFDPSDLRSLLLIQIIPKRECSQTGIVPRPFRSCCINETNECPISVDLLVPLIWSELRWIIDPGPDHPRGMYPILPASSSCCVANASRLNAGIRPLMYWRPLSREE